TLNQLQISSELKQTLHSLTFCLFPKRCNSSTEGTIYKYRAKTLNGSQTVNFSDYAGKAVLVVNVATY
uniref:Uncharacterized protein n=1 Tax=Amphilophus citrinellus TaxID=61819 RepID=A0A3Q0RUF4_AMPCI